MSSIGAAARFGLRSARRRSGRIAATVVAVGLATALAVAAFGLSAQLQRLVGSTGVEMSIGALLPDGTVVITAGTPGATEPTAISEELVDRAGATEGVLDAAGTYEQPIAVRIARGTQDDRPPALRGLVFSAEWNPTRWTVLDGAPTFDVASPDEVRATGRGGGPGADGPLGVALDAGGLATAAASVGEPIRLQTPTGGVDAVVVALVEQTAPGVDGRSPSEGSAPPTVADAHIVMPRADLARILGAQGRVDRITVTPRPGVGTEELVRRLRAVLPKDLELRSAADPTVEQARAVAAVSDGIVTLTTAVAVVAALVAALLVANTMSIVAAQRRIEVALARCIGMSRPQVMGSFLVEGLSVGVGAGALGLAAGVPLSVLAVRVVYPDTAATPMLTATMVLAALLIGVGVTVLSSVAPAWRLARTPPMAALGAVRSHRAHRSLLLVGVLPLLGLVGRAAGRRRPLLRMAAGQPARDPRRAGAIVATLFLSLTLVGAVMTVSASVRSSIQEQYVSDSGADLYLRRRGVVRVDPAALEARLGVQDRRGYVDLSRVEGSLVGPDGIEPSVRAASLGDAASVFDLGQPLLDAGNAQGGAPGGAPAGGSGRGSDGAPTDVSADASALLSEASAARLGVGTGDRVTLRSTSGRDEQAVVRGLYRNSSIVGPALVERSLADRVDADGTFELAGIVLDDRAPIDRVRRWIDRSIGGFNRLGVDTPAGFAATDTDIADTVTRLVLVLLSGTLALGAVGAANNISLSVNERRRELAMLRAIGARRGQVRSLVTVEAVLLTAGTGGLGALVGVGIGAVAVRSAPEQFAASVVVPWAALVIVVAVAAALGWSAAALPATVASRRPPLQGLDGG